MAALACEAVGRSYLASSDASVERMAQVLVSKPLDSSVHIQALAAMQRLSLRRPAQDRMIAMGLVEWAVRVLGRPEGLGASEFSLEFGSAMLMNLALRSMGKRRCLSLEVLPLAMELIERLAGESVPFGAVSAGCEALEPANQAGRSWGGTWSEPGRTSMARRLG